MSTMAANWASIPLTGMSSYTFSSLPEWIQEIGQTALRRVVVSYLRDWTRDAQPLAKVVDLGCGVGDWTMEYLSFARQVVGVDVNPQFLRDAALRARSQPNGDQVRLVQDNLAAFRDYEGAQLICMGGCIHYLNMQELSTLFQRLRQALAPGGKAYVRTTVTSGLRGAYQTGNGYYRKRALYENLFAESGFDIVRSCSSRHLVVQQLCSDLLELPGPRSREALVEFVEAGCRVRETMRRNNEFWNWFLVRRDDGQR
jgi:SAM-dependent methyltransferase